jgi:ABC-type polysaccharide/polyol phosphate transport system ATPase subunit
MDAVKSLYQRSLLLNKGRIASLGDTETVINAYLAMLQKGSTQ